jgi:hypothetical protein
MNKILDDVVQRLIVDDTWDLAWSYLLEWPLGEKLVYAVCKWLEEIAKENGETVGETVRKIIEEHEEDEE